MALGGYLHLTQQHKAQERGLYPLTATGGVEVGKVRLPLSLDGLGIQRWRQWWVSWTWVD